MIHCLRYICFWFVLILIYLRLHGGGSARVLATGLVPRIRRERNARRPISRVLSLREQGMTIHLGRPSPNASCGLPGRRRGNPPAQGRSPMPVAPIRPSSRWGLPCRRRYRRRGALLPHPFTLTRRSRGFGRRFAFCGTVPRVAPAGCYPAPCPHGARTFLTRKQASRRGHPAVWRKTLKN